MPHGIERQWPSDLHGSFSQLRPEALLTPGSLWSGRFVKAPAFGNTVTGWGNGYDPSLIEVADPREDLLRFSDKYSSHFYLGSSHYPLDRVSIAPTIGAPEKKSQGLPLLGCPQGATAHSAKLNGRLLEDDSAVVRTRNAQAFC